MGRPKKDIDPEKVRRLASYGLTVDEIAAVLDCGRRTLFTRFGTAIKMGHQCRNALLRRKQFKTAMGGNVKMLIWLGIQHLEQAGKVQHSVADDGLEFDSGPSGGQAPDAQGSGGQPPPGA